MNKIGAVLLQHLQALKMVCWKPSQGCAGLAMTGGAQASLADIRDKKLASFFKISRGSVVRMNSLTLSTLLGNAKFVAEEC
jgi:hypothetical protein